MGGFPRTARLSIARRTSGSACSDRTPCSRKRDGGIEYGGQQRNDKGDTIMRRVVITGMGIVSSIGNNTQEVLASLFEAKSGITRADKYAELGFRFQVQGAPTLHPADVIDRRAMRFLAEGAAWNHIAME